MKQAKNSNSLLMTQVTIVQGSKNTINYDGDDDDFIEEMNRDSERTNEESIDSRT